MDENPPGKWVETFQGTLFRNNEIMALYGFVKYKVRSGSGFPWLWEARVIFSAQEITAPPITGYAPTKSEAMEIVECILRNTHTCQFPPPTSDKGK